MGTIGGTMVRGDIGGEAGGEVGADMEELEEREAERGLCESLRRQLYTYEYTNTERGMAPD